MAPWTQGRIERWPQTLKNRIVLEDDGLPGALKHRIEALVDHCNHQRHHEGLQILTSADVCFGRGNTILRRREGIKRKTIERDDCCIEAPPHDQANQMGQTPSWLRPLADPKTPTTDTTVATPRTNSSISRGK